MEWEDMLCQYSIFREVPSTNTPRALKYGDNKGHYMYDENKWKVNFFLFHHISYSIALKTPLDQAIRQGVRYPKSLSDIRKLFRI